MPGDPAVYVHVNPTEVSGFVEGMFADVGDGPDKYVAEPVPPKVRADGVTLFIFTVPSLVTVITTVITSPVLTFVGVADIDDMRLGAAKTKLEKAVEINTNTIIIETNLL